MNKKRVSAFHLGKKVFQVAILIVSLGLIKFSDGTIQEAKDSDWEEKKYYE